MHSDSQELGNYSYVELEGSAICSAQVKYFDDDTISVKGTEGTYISNIYGMK